MNDTLEREALRRLHDVVQSIDDAPVSVVFKPMFDELLAERDAAMLQARDVLRRK